MDNNVFKAMFWFFGQFRVKSNMRARELQVPHFVFIC